MTDAELQSIVDRAFASVERPSVFTHCDCDECRDLSAMLQNHDNTTLGAEGLHCSICLLTPEALRYFVPALVRLSLSDDDGENSIIDSFVHWELCQPISKKEPPNHHPKAASFDRPQAMAILAFLEHIHETGFNDGDERPRELRRGIRNWRRFVDCFGPP